VVAGSEVAGAGEGGLREAGERVVVGCGVGGREVAVERDLRGLCGGEEWQEQEEEQAGERRRHRHGGDRHGSSRPELVISE
jgi:hypothetical protein